VPSFTALKHRVALYHGLFTSVPHFNSQCSGLDVKDQRAGDGLMQLAASHAVI